MQATLLPPKHSVFCSPVTANRELAECLIANVPMIELLSAELTRAGFQILDHSEAGVRTLRIPIDTWIELGALLLLGRNEKSARLCDSDGVVLAWKGFEKPEDCVQELRTEAGCFPIVYPWDLLRMNEEVLALMDETSLAGDISPLATITGCVRVAPTARIHPGTVIEGPVVIGPGTQIGPNALIRGAETDAGGCAVYHDTPVRLLPVSSA